MKISMCLTFLGLASCAALPSGGPVQGPSAANENRISIYLGQRSLDEDDYAPVEDQATLGFEYSQEAAGSAFGWEVGIMGSSDDDRVAGFDVEARTGELYGGIRKSFGDDAVRPFVGGGLAIINSEIEVVGAGSDDDSSFAAYLHGGVALAVSESFLLGLDLRLLFGSQLEIVGIDTDADYGQIALFLGFGF